MRKTVYLVVLAVIALGACTNDQKWKEEVKIADGRLIIVERETLHEGGGDEWSHNKSGSKPRERRIRFSISGSSAHEIEWQSKKLSPMTWPEKPLVLDFEGNHPIVITSVAISNTCEIYSKYVYKDNKWLEDLLPQTFEPRSTNLLIRDGVDMPAFVSLPTKERENASSDYRRSLKQIGPHQRICD